MLCPQAANLVVDHAGLDRASPWAVDAQDHACDILFVEGTLQCRDEPFGTGLSLGLDDPVEVNEGRMPFLVGSILAPVNEGDQRDNKVNEPQCLEKNTPTPTSLLLFKGGESQFLERLPLPMRVIVSWGIIHRGYPGANRWRRPAL